MHGLQDDLSVTLVYIMSTQKSLALYEQSINVVNNIIRNVGEPDHLLVDFEKGAISAFKSKTANSRLLFLF